MIYTTVEETPKSVLIELLDKFNYYPNHSYFIRYERHPSTGPINPTNEMYSFSRDMIEGTIEYTKEKVIKQLFYKKVENLLND